MYGFPMLCAMIWWVVDAHKWFKGPKVNIEHEMLGRQGNVIEGKADESGGSSSNSITREARVFDDKKAAELA